MTKYVLHGGNSSWDKEGNKGFFAEMVKGLENPTILCVYFSRAKEEWNKLFEQDQKHFTEWGEVDGTFVLATEDNFRSQVESADVIYMRGGSNEMLADVLSKNKVDFSGKVVGGSSAGANVLSVKFYENEEGKVLDGLGIIPVKVFCHCHEQEEELKELDSTGDKLPIYVLPEYEWLVYDE